MTMVCPCFFFFFFFLNQQFITQHTVVDRGSDYVATYMQSKLTLKYKRKEKKKQKTQRKQRIITEIIQRQRLLDYVSRT